MKQDKIIVCSSGKLQEEKTDCPFWVCGGAEIIPEVKTDTHCHVSGIECRYGLTEIHVPKKCPLKKCGVFSYVYLK